MLPIILSEHGLFVKSISTLTLSKNNPVLGAIGVIILPLLRLQFTEYKSQRPLATSTPMPIIFRI